MEWYEELNMEQDPFIDTESTQLIGYEDTIQEIFYRIAAGDMLFIEGREGNGKTALLKRVIARFKGRGKIIYIDGKKLDKNINIQDTLKGRVGFWSRMMGKELKNMILLMDDVEELSRKNSERIKYYYDQNYIKAVIFTGTNYKTAAFTDSLKERISKVVKLKEPTEDEAVEIVKSRMQNNTALPEDIIRELYKRSNKSLKTLMIYCSKVLDYAIREKREKTVTKEHLSMVLDGIKTEEKEEKKKKKEEPIEIKVEKVEDEKYRPTTITIIDDDFRPAKETKAKESTKHEKETKPASKKEKKDLAEEYY
jgi:energy-coupling factor transporter ATP-binding protein EcfA2